LLKTKGKINLVSYPNMDREMKMREGLSQICHKVGDAMVPTKTRRIENPCFSSHDGFSSSPHSSESEHEPHRESLENFTDHETVDEHQPNSPKIKKLKRRKKRHGPEETDENREIKKKIDEQIDELSKYKGWHYVAAWLRRQVSFPNALPQKYFTAKGLTKSEELLKYDTNYGEISVLSTNMMSCGTKKSMVKEALFESGIDLDELEKRPEISEKNVVKIDTEEVKKSQEYMHIRAKFSRQLKKYTDECEIYGEGGDLDTEQKNMIKYLAVHRRLLKDIMDDSRRYTYAYNSLREIFTEASTKGDFPRYYQYNNVVCRWEDSTTRITNFYRSVTEYLDQYDLKNNTNKLLEFNAKMDELRIKENRYKIRFMLDDEDFEEEYE
jgi:hypothetical protein